MHLYTCTCSSLSSQIILDCHVYLLYTVYTLYLSNIHTHVAFGTHLQAFCVMPEIEMISCYILYSTVYTCGWGLCHHCICTHVHSSKWGTHRHKHTCMIARDTVIVYITHNSSFKMLSVCWNLFADGYTCTYTVYILYTFLLVNTHVSS